MGSLEENVKMNTLEEATGVSAVNMCRYKPEELTLLNALMLHGAAGAEYLQLEHNYTH
jgi:hypothetical protein